MLFKTFQAAACVQRAIIQATRVSLDSSFRPIGLVNFFLGPARLHHGSEGSGCLVQHSFGLSGAVASNQSAFSRSTTEIVNRDSSDGGAEEPEL